jgi:hypothetical protein
MYVRVTYSETLFYNLVLPVLDHEVEVPSSFLVLLELLLILLVESPHRRRILEEQTALLTLCVINLANKLQIALYVRIVIDILILKRYSFLCIYYGRTSRFTNRSLHILIDPLPLEIDSSII